MIPSGEEALSQPLRGFVKSSSNNTVPEAGRVGPTVGPEIVSAAEQARATRRKTARGKSFGVDMQAILSEHITENTAPAGARPFHPTRPGDRALGPARNAR